MRLELEKYKGSRSRHTCPACGSHRSFARYRDEQGDYIDESVGRCNRESKCGYHKKPKEFFAENQQLSNFKPKAKSRANYGFVAPNKTARIADDESQRFDYIPNDAFLPTLSGYERNYFVQFLLDLFPDDATEVEKAVKDYFVGTFRHPRGDYTSFPSIDRGRRVCRAKLIRFDRATGKRCKGDFDTSSLPAMLKLKEDFHYKQIFFGEHLLALDKQKPVAVVEAEKTAIIASICFPEFVWLGANSKAWLNAERLEQIGSRQIILYPDADGFDLWTEKANEARLRGLTVKVSNLIENHATDEQKAAGYDLVDYLINQQREINEYNENSDAYNARLDAVLKNEDLKASFNLILDEQKAVMMIDGGLSDEKSEYLITRPDNLRLVVMSL